MFICRWLLTISFLAVTAYASDSVFVDGAFAGSFSAAVYDSNGVLQPDAGGPVSFVQVPESTGPGLINALGDPSFNANNCPAPTEKREYYQEATDQTLVACTNGSSFIVRLRDLQSGEAGSVRFTQIDAGPPAVARGSGGTNFFPFFKVVLTYQNGSPSTPFGRVPADYMITTGGNPAPGTLLTPGSTQNLNLNVRYRLYSTKTGTVQATLLSDGQVLATSSSFGVGLTTEITRTFSFSSVVIPNSGTLTIRSDMRSTSTGALLATSNIVLPIYQAAPLTVAPKTLRFNSPAGTTPQADAILVTTTSAQPLPYTATIVNASKWLSLPAASGTITTSASLPVAMNPTGLAPGYYFDTVRIVTSQGTLDVPVTLDIAAVPTSLNAEPNGLRFDVRQGQGSPTAQTLTLYHSGPVGTSSPWTARIVSGASVIQLSATNGTATLANPSTLSVSLSPTATATAGPAYSVIEIATPNNAPEYVTVVANVVATTVAPQPLLSPVSLVFIATQGGSAPSSQRLQVNVSELTPTAFTVGISGGGSVLTATPVNSTASTSTPGLVDVSVNPASLGVGTFTGLVNITIGTQLRTARVLIFVLPAPSASEAIPGARSATGCTPTRVLVREISLPERYVVPGAWPQSLIVQLFDNCANRLKTGTVTAVFANGDAPLRLTPDAATGDFSATWTPQTALNTAVKITIRGDSSGLTQGTLDINGSVNANVAPPPTLAAGGILSNLNSIVGAPVAPGTVALVYGDNFFSGEGFESAPLPPLQPRFKGAQLLIGGYVAPFYYISKTQAAAQIPTELAPGRTYSALMEVNGAYSSPQQIEIVNLMPGTVSLSGALVAQHAADYQLVTQQNPAKPGESLIMYLVGMGATSPNVATGAPAPVSPLAQTTVQPIVTIDGQNSTIQFAGLTPGFAGLYQINFVVPSNARDGDLDVVIKQEGLAANATKLTVKK